MLPSNTLNDLINNVRAMKSPAKLRSSTIVSPSGLSLRPQHSFKMNDAVFQSIEFNLKHNSGTSIRTPGESAQ